jgi:alkylation response protein AidB-like acyl-CoA dehydrogenase
MDYRFTDEEESFRSEVRTFLRSELPAEWDYDPFELTEERWDFARDFTKKLAGKGWVAPAWPQEYGGQGMGYMKQVVLSEELAYHRAPNTSLIGVTYAGPTVIVYGNEEQKKQFLPGITSGEIVWCQGYSEPNAGSDLASLQTRAVKDGDDYVINGTKIWSSNAHKANWCFLLARTDPDAPKHKGITYFMTPMDAPGISVRPLINMADEHVFNEIVFDNVRIPVKYRVGDENNGWYIGMTTLDFERSNISTAAQYRRTFEQLVGYVKEQGTGNKEQGNGLVSNGRKDGLQAKLAELAIENQVGRYLSYRVASMQERNQIPNYESSAAKVYHSEYGQRLARAGVQIMGLYGILDEESKHTRLRGRFARTYLTSVGSTIAAGTSEIQRGIIAQRGLGLSRI